MLDLAVLGLLKEAPMSGYELKKQLSLKLGPFWRVSFGSLYPCLKRLSAAGALEIEASFTSRKKRVYRITSRGERLFQELLESTDAHELEQDRFRVRLAFFRYLRPESRVEQLERRRGYLQERLADFRASLRQARDRLDAYSLELLRHGLDEREREIAWLDRLIAAERGAFQQEGAGQGGEPSRAPDPGAGAGPGAAGPAAAPSSTPRDPRLPAETG